MFRSTEQMQTWEADSIHEGIGNSLIRTVLSEADSDVGIMFMHDDTLEPGTTFGQHPHEGMEEIYFVVEGHGTMILDGEEFPMKPGDVSLCKSGHSHGIINSDDGPMRLIVIGVKR